MEKNIVIKDELVSLYPANIFHLTQNIKSFIRNNGIQEILVFGYSDPNIHTHFWIHNAFFNALNSVDIGIPVRHLAVIPNELRQRKVLCIFTYDNKNNYHEGVIASVDWFYLMLNHTYDNTYPDFIKQCAASKRAVIFHVWRGKTTNLSNPALQWPHSFDARTMRYSLTWAARLPPNLILMKIPPLPIEDRCVFIGTVWHRNIDQINELAKWCVENIIPLDIFGKQYEKINITHPALLRIQNRVITDEEARDVILRAKYAPSLQGKTQLPYIPCRAFINATYGRYVLTNNWAVKKMLPFSIYHEDTFQLMDLAKKNISTNESIDDKCINDIAENHSYINRLSELLTLFHL